MTWTPLATISVTQDWQYTPIIAPDLGYVRLKFATAGIPLWIAQADITNPNDVLFWDDRRFIVPPHSKIFEFEAPPFFDDRVLAVRLPIFSTSWDIQFEVSDMPTSRAPVTIQPVVSNTVNAASVAAATTSTSLLAANANRKGASITNNSTALLYVELGATASTTAYTVWLGQGDMYELPVAYTGAISGIWAAANGNALVREFV